MRYLPKRHARTIKQIRGVLTRVLVPCGINHSCRMYDRAKRDFSSFRLIAEVQQHMNAGIREFNTG